MQDMKKFCKDVNEKINKNLNFYYDGNEEILICEVKIKDNFQDINDDLDFVELQSIIESIKGKDKKKLKELEFLEQLWFIINPSKIIQLQIKIKKIITIKVMTIHLIIILFIRK